MKRFFRHPQPLGGRPHLLLLGFLALGAAATGCNIIGNHQGYEPVQPIEYSHALHAGEYKIPCLYCHFGAERGRHAGVPPTQVCMNCHSQVKKDSPAIKKLAQALATGKPFQWIKVHRLPDFNYFDHRGHVQVGIECQACHGRVEKMVRVRQEFAMNMGWCLDCHRKTKARGVAGKEVTPPTDCSACHY